MIVRAGQSPPAHWKHRAEHQEREVPHKFVRAGPNVMDLEDVVVDGRGRGAAASLREYFESEGWEVTIAIAEGPRRRRSPTIVMRPVALTREGPRHRSRGFPHASGPVREGSGPFSTDIPEDALRTIQPSNRDREPLSPVLSPAVSIG